MQKLSLKKKLTQLLVDRKFLSTLQLTLSVFISMCISFIGTANNSLCEKILIIFMNIVLFIILYGINQKILLPLNNSIFAKRIYKYDKENNYCVSPTSIRFIENLNEKEQYIVERGLGFIYLDTYPESLNDSEFLEKYQV
nr:hypothetical protein GTC16762_31230 [Pigmentibacter ruber]